MASPKPANLFYLFIINYCYFFFGGGGGGGRIRPLADLPWGGGVGGGGGGGAAGGRGRVVNQEFPLKPFSNCNKAPYSIQALGF